MILWSYIKVALRTLRAQAGYTIVKVAALALGMVIALLVVVLVHDQRSYDRFHETADRTYRVIWERQGTGGQRGIAKTPAPLGPDLQVALPEVEATLRLVDLWAPRAVHEGTSVPIDGLFAEPSFFDLFSFALVAGHPERALAEPNSVVITEAAADRLFGTANPMGQVVTLDHVGDLTVTGVVRVGGEKSHLSFDLLASFATLRMLDGWPERLDARGGLGEVVTYLRLQSEAAPGGVASHLAATAQANAPALAERFNLRLQPLTGIALGPALGREISTPPLPLLGVVFIGLLAFVIMATAGFNYVGLTVAQSLQRAKEVGIRKAMGAERSQVTTQLLIESGLTALLALPVAWLLLATLLPYLNGLRFVQSLDIHVAPSVLYDPIVLGTFLVVALAVGLAAGAYPALFLSRFQPTRAVKGLETTRQTGGRLRRGLIVLQLTLGLVFVMTAMLMIRQFTYMTNADYGLRTEDVITVRLQDQPYAPLADALQRDPAVEQAAAASGLPIVGPSVLTGIAAPDAANADAATITGIAYGVSPAFTDVFGMELIAGRPLAETATGQHPGVVINERAVQALGFATPREAVGRMVRIGRFDAPRPIRGVVRDVRFLPLASPVLPLVLYADRSDALYASIRVRDGQANAVMARLVDVWATLDSAHPLDAALYSTRVQDNEINRGLRDAIRVVGVLAVIALAIACLGVLSMAAYGARARTKEVGIRKALGASSTRLVWTLSREFAGLAVLAAALAVPVAWGLNGLWLQEFAHRVALGPLVIGGSLGTVGALVAVAVGSQALRTAWADPVDALHHE